ncbi:hypothetical protein FANTH_12814 [Fusarium anthophilum]|uniref:Fungal N-terminal domain-containing protein n=1 Tax=Fusarium anthophilum TaxID=48485 RepID=A0A8H5DR77_9HYPO|nr:hypothetical protein FANTH_12814 [Fusarium anthophilum]
MSGAEAAILGLGILCHAMQILIFAKDSIHVYRNIRDGRAPDPKLDSYLKNAKICFNEMNQTAAQIGPLGQTQQQIVDVGKKVHDCVDELQQYALALWRGKELEDAEDNLQRHEQLLHTLLLDQVCTQSQAAEITSLQAFQHLEGALRDIISQLAHGSTKVLDLVTALSADLSSRVADEHATTRNAVEDQMSSLEATICEGMSQSIDQLRQELLDREQDKAFEKQYEQLLSSLRFPEMNSQKNKISNNYPGTFTWIFDRHGSWQSSYSSSSESNLPDTDSKLSEDTQDSGDDSTSERGFDSFPDWLESDSNVFWAQASVRYKRDYPDWSLEELSAALIWSLRTSSEAFCIFLDGLDEAVETMNAVLMSWSQNIDYDAYLQMAISMCCDDRLSREGLVEQDLFLAIDTSQHQEAATDIRLCSPPNGSVEDGLLDALKGWQSSGLFSGHKYSTPLACSTSSSNLLEVQMIEAIISVFLLRRDSVHLASGVTSLLEK